MDKKLFSLYDEAPLGVCITDPDYQYLYVNDAYCTLYGYSREELLGKPFTQVVPPDARDTLKELHDQFMGRSYELQGEWEVMDKSGRRFPILSNAAYIPKEQGGPLKITFVSDISAQQDREQLLEQEVQRRKELETVRDRVERIVRHDMKNPLSGIIGMVALMRLEETLSDEQKNQLSLLLDSAYQLLSLVDGSFDIMKMENGTYPLDAQPVPVRDLLDALSTQMTPLSKSLGVVLEISPLREELAVSGEKVHLIRMMVNIVRNALEASPSGDLVTVKVRRGKASEAEPGSIEIAVENRGLVPPEVRGRFFEQYVTSGKKHGTGLGTYIAKLIAEIHGGSIRLESVNETNTLVMMLLPESKPKG